MERRFVAAALLAVLSIATAATRAASVTAVPPTAHRLVELGDAREEKGEHQEAIADYNEAIADYPDYAYAYASRCQSEWALDQNQTAIRDCNRAIALDPSSAYAYRQLAMALADTGETNAALAAVDKSIVLDPSRSYTYAVRCQILTDLNRYDEAYGDCGQAIKMDPASQWGHLQLGRAQLEKGDYAAADATLTWVITHHAESESAWYNRALARLHTPNLSGALYDIAQYIAVDPTDGDGYYVKARIEIARNDKGAAGDAASEALRRYIAAGDKAGVKKSKAFIADNDLESASSKNTMLAGVLGGAIVVIGIIVFLAASAIQIWGLWRILDRAGLQGPLALLCLIPFGSIACLCVLAFSTWPRFDMPANETKAAAPLS